MKVPLNVTRQLRNFLVQLFCKQEKDTNILNKVKKVEVAYNLVIDNCEAQGKGRAKGQPRKVTQRSFIDGGWWMVDILSLMLYIKFGCHHHLPSTVLLLISMIQPSMDQVR